MLKQKWIDIQIDGETKWQFENDYYRAPASLMPLKAGYDDPLSAISLPITSF